MKAACTEAARVARSAWSWSIVSVPSGDQMLSGVVVAIVLFYHSVVKGAREKSSNVYSSSAHRDSKSAYVPLDQRPSNVV